MVSGVSVRSPTHLASVCLGLTCSVADIHTHTLCMQEQRRWCAWSWGFMEGERRTNGRQK